MDAVLLTIQLFSKGNLIKRTRFYVGNLGALGRAINFKGLFYYGDEVS